MIHRPSLHVPRRVTAPTHGPRGFTLVELLIVIGIIGLLIVAILPNITNIFGVGNETVTRTRIEHLKGMIETYAKQTGDFPPSEFAKAEKGVKFKGDATNEGIECLLIHLHQKSLGPSYSLEDKQDWLGNTDGDDNGSTIPELRTTKKLEILDAWGVPLVYFRNDSYARPQEIAMPEDGGSRAASALKDERGFLNPRKYQILSAGPDGEFGTPDDVTYPQQVPK